ncbi:CBS domain-containing protein [Candidatus Chloroploca asiatica]|uniref:CBS domain-containing protein n=1 Tax=Candidatus Chloroploca asiatica TaxID=1506545 RepID=A0A2H3LC95_9CHLR|nr:CBS domain-containing protein [Candidatus Chloroploca asiatica]PDW00067.1 CBS domain-containing protein [Candidatus Chloroploca asiatica]
MDSVRVWMSAPPVLARDTMTLPEARQLLTELNIRRLPVVDSEGDLLGIVTEGDVNRISDSAEGDLAEYSIYYRVKDLPVREFMRRPVLTVTPDTCLRDAAQLMITHHIHGVPVVLGKRVIGVITVSDLLRWMVNSEEDCDTPPLTPKSHGRD